VEKNYGPQTPLLGGRAALHYSHRVVAQVTRVINLIKNNEEARKNNK
jgi:hypothetical protein